MTETIIGIDLGTTNSEVAVFRDGKVEVLKDGDRVMLPSFVGVGEDGDLLVGEAARNQFPLYPERTVKSIKRRMGSNETVEMAGTSYTPQEVSAILLRRLKGIAEAALGREIAKAVITVPAYFNDAQRQATREAGEIAGLEVVRIINEPTAAALSYEADHREGKRILVYDLGGGTFDVSVVRVEGEVVEVVASHGNNQLGGDDFDRKVVEHLVERLREKPGVDPETSHQAMARLTRAAEEAKKTLSAAPFAAIEEEFLMERDGQPVHLSLELARDDYEAMIQPYVDETLEAIHIALRDAGLAVADIDEVLMAGGTTRTPLIAERLEREFRKQPRREVDPDLCVAMGAAIQAAVIAGQEASAVLVDVTPYTFGTSAIGTVDGLPSYDKFVPIIRRNTPIPVTRSEVFYTHHDRQDTVDVSIYQGEAPLAGDNVLVGEFFIRGLSKVPRGNPVVLEVSLDVNGVLHVSALEKNTGLTKSIDIDNAIARFEQEEMDQAKARIESLFGDEGEVAEEAQVVEEAGPTQVSQQARIQAVALVEKAERMAPEASEDDQEDMRGLIRGIRAALDRGDAEALAEAVEELSDILYYLQS